MNQAYNAPLDASDAAEAFAQQYEADHVFSTFWEPIMAVVE